MKEPTNFQSLIHDKDYLNRFLNNIIDNHSNIIDSGRSRESLDGFWAFTIDPYDTCLRAKWYEEEQRDEKGGKLPLDYNFDKWDRVKIPGCWNFYRENLYNYEGVAVFTRTFTWQTGKAYGDAERVFLKFNGIQYDSKIFLNRQYLGCHNGGSTQFFIEITNCLLEENRILIVTENIRRKDRVPAENMDWFNYGGIHRSVEIIRTPSTFIQDFFIHLVPDGKFDSLNVEIDVNGPDDTGDATIRIPELSIEKNVAITNGRGTGILKAKPELWSPGFPKLYKVEVQYKKDSITERTGFREIKVDGTEILLNGKNIYFCGICMHEESLTGGKTVSPQEITSDLNTAKELGCNFVRLAHYPHSHYAAKIADELGIMLWEEIPVYWDIDFENQITYKDAENQLSELIKRDRNRASVIIWSVGNENADSDSRLAFMRSLAKHAKMMDPSRLVSAACLVDKINLRISDRLTDYLDIIGINEYYGWYDPEINDLRKILANSNPIKPVLIAEFGADAEAGRRGSADDFFTEDHQRIVYQQQLSILETIPYIRGISPWILYDFRCPRRTNEFQRGYNRKGIIAEDKKTRKLVFYTLKKFFKSSLNGDS